jgi:hypothetical protein
LVRSTWGGGRLATLGVVTPPPPPPPPGAPRFASPRGGGRLASTVRQHVLYSSLGPASTSSLIPCPVTDSDHGAREVATPCALGTDPDRLAKCFCLAKWSWACRSRQDGGRHGRRQPAEAGASTRRAAMHRRDNAGGVPAAHGERRCIRAAIPAGAQPVGPARRGDLGSRAQRAAEPSPHPLVAPVLSIHSIL